MKKFIAFLLLIAALLSIAFVFNQPGAAKIGASVFLPLIARNMNSTPPPPPGTWSLADKTAIQSIVLNAGILGKKAENTEEVTTGTITKTIGSEAYWLDVENHYVVRNSTDLLNLGNNDDVIWPGALIEGDQAHDFVYTPITLPRAPVVLSVNLENVACAGNLTQVVNDPNLSNIREGVRLLLQEARSGCTIVPAQADWNKQEVHSEQHLNMALGANINYSTINLKTNFDFTDTSKKTRIIAAYRQIFYTVNINTPITQADLFDPTRTTVDQIRAAMPAGTDPMYVAGVRYGMMALMFFESSYSSKDLNFALDAAYNGQVISATITGTVSAKTILENSKINIVVYGGSTAGLKEVYEGINGFYAVINASASGGPDSPGVALIYNFRNLADNNASLITFSTNYSISMSRFPVRPRIRVYLDKFFLESAYSEDWPFNTLLEMREMAIYVSAGNCIAPSCPTENLLGYSSGSFYTIGVGGTYDPGDSAYVDIIYDNRHTPLNWDTDSWLRVRSKTTEDDIWPDPWDVAEFTQTWATGPLMLEDAELNLQGRPERTYVHNLTDGGNYTFKCTFVITLMNP